MAQLHDIIDELHNELDPDVQSPTPLQVGVIIRAAAERVLEERDEERAAMIAYMKYHFPNNARLLIALDQCEIGAHRRNRSQSMEAVVERKR